MLCVQILGASLSKIYNSSTAAYGRRLIAGVCLL